MHFLWLTGQTWLIIILILIIITQMRRTINFPEADRFFNAETSSEDTHSAPDFDQFEQTRDLAPRRSAYAQIEELMEVLQK